MSETKDPKVFSISGTPIGPGYGIQKTDDGYLCSSMMTFVTIKITEKEVNDIVINDLQNIKTILKNYSEKHNLYKIFDYCTVMFVEWIISGCDYNGDITERNAVHAICAKYGRTMIDKINIFLNNF